MPPGPTPQAPVGAPVIGFAVQGPVKETAGYELSPKILSACRAAVLMVPPGADAQIAAGKPKTTQGSEGVPGAPGSADNCQPPLEAPLRIIGTTTPELNPLAAQEGSALGGLQKYPGSAF